MFTIGEELEGELGRTGTIRTPHEQYVAAMALLCLYFVEYVLPKSKRLRSKASRRMPPSSTANSVTAV